MVVTLADGTKNRISDERTIDLDPGTETGESSSTETTDTEELGEDSGSEDGGELEVSFLL